MNAIAPGATATPIFWSNSSGCSSHSGTTVCVHFINDFPYKICQAASEKLIVNVRPRSGSPGSSRGKTLSEEDNAIRQKKVEANILRNVTPLRVGRAGTGLDIANTAVFLASDESMWTTGQALIVDGGMTTFDAPNKGWMADDPPIDPVAARKIGPKL